MFVQAKDQFGKQISSIKKEFNINRRSSNIKP